MPQVFGVVTGRLVSDLVSLYSVRREGKKERTGVEIVPEGLSDIDVWNGVTMNI